ncbi:RNA-directed DNA polymerase, eukaryota [Tanacetum coccineum]
MSAPFRRRPTEAVLLVILESCRCMSFIFIFPTYLFTTNLHLASRAVVLLKAVIESDFKKGYLLVLEAVYAKPCGPFVRDKSLTEISEIIFYRLRTGASTASSFSAFLIGLFLVLFSAPFFVSSSFGGGSSESGQRRVSVDAVATTLMLIRSIGNGDNTSFWKDKWHNEGVLKDVFPRLYALERHQNVTIHTKLIDYSLVNSFRRNPRSGVEEFQLDNLSRLVSTITLSSAVDRYVWSLENSGEFSVKSIRQVIDANCFPVIHSATRWVKSVPLKVNIMAWKIKTDGLPTRINISRRGIEIDSIVCPICNSGAESSCHIFFQCNLVRQLARKISSWWNVDYVDVSSYEEWYTWLVSLRLQANLKAVFEGIFYCLWWSVWMFRNKILFEKDTPSQARIFDNIVSNSYYLCKFRCKTSFKWIDWLKNPYLVIV